MKLYTRTGDEGQTSLFDGTRVAKDHVRVAAYGAVDETNACLGAAAHFLQLHHSTNSNLAVIAARLFEIQKQLFEVGADLATPVDSRKRDRVASVRPEDVSLLERWIDEAVVQTPPLRNFVLPGGSEAACRLHVARTVSRRAERDVITLGRGEPLGDQIIPYLNRLSDLLFAWSRLANHAQGVADVEWTPRNG